MKLKITSILLLAVVASFAFVAFAPKADVYKVDVAKSSILWNGKKTGGAHNGTVNLSEGTLAFNGKKLAQGGFIADMTSIKDADKNGGLEKHLKADDFFGAEKFPKASFIIKKVEGNAPNFTVTGDLMIKGITNSVSFPVNVVWNDDKTITATADKITIDRTKYGIKFKSKSIFSDLGDNFIYDDFTLSVKLVAAK
ncbi:MAG: YceI family protein [Pedobacter sp.]|nr:YceI family protein [Pedobacter sp.]MDQ8053524.1 YceI family protein [Pedobacter sp.]